MPKINSEMAERLEKKFGKGSIFNLASDEPIAKIPVIPTGSIALDIALGVGGYPEGRITEIHGVPSSGKSTLALHAVTNANAMGHDVLYIDTEYAIDISYADAIGIDRNKFWISQPDTAEDALGILENAITFGYKLIILDSVAAMPPRAEIQGEAGDAHIGLLARLMSQACRRLVGLANKNKTVIIFINQMRANIGVMGYGPKTSTPGGYALEHAYSVRLKTARIQGVKIGTDDVASKTRVEVKKNKVAVPLKTAEFDIEFGVGIDKYGELLSYALDYGLIKKAGSWFKDEEGNSIGQGAPSAKEFLRQNKVLCTQIYDKAYASHGLSVPEIYK